MSPYVLDVRFYVPDTGSEPVRNWLRELPADERRVIGEDIKTVQIGWPLGMPLVRKLSKSLWKIRIHLVGQVARIIFTIIDGKMILLHGFIKKSQTTPGEDIDLARRRLKQLGDH